MASKSVYEGRTSIFDTEQEILQKKHDDDVKVTLRGTPVKKKYSIYLTQEEYEKAVKICKKTGNSFTQIFRQMLCDYQI